MVTPKLFEAYPNAEILAIAKPEDIFPYIRSISYPNNKAKHLAGMGYMLMEKFNGKIPSTVEELQLLPGVGRKTANVIGSVIFSKPLMAVDTHVFRVAARIGLTINAKTPLSAELQLVKYFPEDVIPIAHHWLILHGRYVCMARRPQCDRCGISSICKYFALKKE